MGLVWVCIFISYSFLTAASLEEFDYSEVIMR